MKKILILVLSCLVITTAAVGCSRGAASGKQNKNASIAATNDIKASKDNQKITEKDVKSMNDSKLIQAAVENDENININDLDIDDQLQGLDDILSDKEPLADIPKNISVSK